MMGLIIGFAARAFTCYVFISSLSSVGYEYTMVIILALVLFELVGIKGVIKDVMRGDDESQHETLQEYCARMKK